MDFFKEKPVCLLLRLKDTERTWYISTLAKSCNVSALYTRRIIKKFEKLGIVKCEKIGKKRFVKITEKGAVIANMLERIADELKS